jgi:hypothetical protein
MYTTKVSIDNFLQRALLASLSCNYAAFLVPIARTADGEHFQNELIEKWGSLDSITADHILVITPSSSSAYVVWHGMSQKEAIVSEGLSLRSRNSRKWDYAFWREPWWERKEFYSGLGGQYTPQGPQSTESIREMRTTMTAAATHIARFFDISEAWLPCIVMLSLQERQVFVIPVSTSFSLFDFVKSIIIAYEPGSRLIREIREKLRGFQDELDEARREQRDLETKESAYKREWEEQRSSICELLKVAARYAEVCSENAFFFIEWLHNKIDTPGEINSRYLEFINQIKSLGYPGHVYDSALKGRIPQYIVNRIESKLPHAIRKRAGEFKDIYGRDPDTFRKKQASLSDKITEIKTEIESLKNKQSSIEKDKGFALAVISYAKERNLKSTQIDLSLTGPLHGWKVTRLTMPAVTNIHGNPSEYTDVNRRALRKAICDAFSLDELEILCDDIEQDMKMDHIILKVDLEMVGGSSDKENKVLHLIEYLDRKNHLSYLVKTIRRERPDLIFQ